MVPILLQSHTDNFQNSSTGTLTVTQHKVTVEDSVTHHALLCYSMLEKFNKNRWKSNCF